MLEAQANHKIVAVVDDMFFAAKIRGTAEALGVCVKFARSIDAALELARSLPASLIIADLHAQGCDPFELAGRLKTDEQLKLIQLLGFFSHVQTALKQRAEEAGYDRIVPRSFFSSNLSKILVGDF